MGRQQGPEKRGRWHWKDPVDTQPSRRGHLSLLCVSARVRCSRCFREGRDALQRAEGPGEEAGSAQKQAVVFGHCWWLWR